MSRLLASSVVRSSVPRASLLSSSTRRSMSGDGHHDEWKVGATVPLPVEKGLKTALAVWVPIGTMCVICFAAIKFQQSKA